MRVISAHAQNESMTPPAAPASDSSTPSVTSCRATRHLLAPSARRTPISWRLTLARDNSRLATFVQAMSSTRLAIARRMTSGWT